MTDYNTIDYIMKIVSGVLAAAGIKARVSYEDSLSRGLVFNISSPDSKLLIGHQGVTLRSLELLVHAIVSKHFAGSEQQVHFSLDVNEYKRRREYQIKQIVKAAVDKLKYSTKPILLAPMLKYERKFVHTYIQEQFPHVTTESVGEDPNRRIKLTI